MKNLKTGLLAGMIFISVSGFSQHKKHIPPPPPPPPPQNVVTPPPPPVPPSPPIRKIIAQHNQSKEQTEVIAPLQEIPAEPPISSMTPT